MRRHIFDYTWYVWLKIWGEVSKFMAVIGSKKPFAMLNPLLLFLKPALSTLGIEACIYDDRLKGTSPYPTKYLFKYRRKTK